MNLRPRPYQGRALPLSYGSDAGVLESARNMPRDSPKLQGPCTAYDTRVISARNPSFAGGFHTLAKLWSCFRHAPGIPDHLREWVVSRHVQVEVLVQPAPLAQTAQGRYPGLHALSGRTPGAPPSGVDLRRSLGIVKDQRVDSAVRRAESGRQVNLTRRSRPCPRRLEQRLPRAKPRPRRNAVAARPKPCGRTCCGGRHSGGRGNPRRTLGPSPMAAASPETAVNLEHPRFLE